MYADGAIHHDHHREQNIVIPSGVSPEALAELVRGFFSDKDNISDKDNFSDKVNFSDKDNISQRAGDQETGDFEEACVVNPDNIGEVTDTASREDFFHFVHPEVDDPEKENIHKQIKRLVRHFGVQQICEYLDELAKNRKILLPLEVKTAHEELIRMGMPDDNSFSYKNFAKYYRKSGQRL